MPSALALDPYALIGSKLGDRYSLAAFVGAGSVSAVYRAKDLADESGGTRVAVRLLKVQGGLEATKRERIVRRVAAFVPTVREVARECATFGGVLDVGSIETTDGRWMPGIVQTWLEGEPLARVLERQRRSAAPPITLARAIEWMTPVADALCFAHSRGVVHGGIAPRNVFVQGERSVEVLDLGVFALLSALQADDAAFAPEGGGAVAFFPVSHATPEHFASRRAPSGASPLGPATDVFSLALLLVELLTGRAPLGDGDESQLEAAAVDPVVRPTPRARGRDLGGCVEAVFERALAVRPGDRYGSANSFWSDLCAASRLSFHPTSSAVPPPLDRVAAPAIRSPIVTRSDLAGKTPQGRDVTPVPLDLSGLTMLDDLADVLLTDDIEYAPLVATTEGGGESVVGDDSVPASVLEPHPVTASRRRTLGMFVLGCVALAAAIGVTGLFRHFAARGEGDFDDLRVAAAAPTAPTATRVEPAVPVGAKGLMPAAVVPAPSPSGVDARVSAVSRRPGSALAPSPPARAGHVRRAATKPRRK